MTETSQAGPRPVHAGPRAVQEELQGMPRRLYPCTPTRLATWLDCPRRYRMTYLDRPPPVKGPPWAHNSLGASIHNALAGWWRLPPAERTVAAAGLAGVEVFHPDQPESEQASLLGLTRDLGLIATGGSDDHGSLTGHRIGSHTAAPGAYEALLSQATGIKPVQGG